MFKFDDLDGMSRLLMIKKQKETIDYWRAMYRLKGAFLLWGKATSDILRTVKFESQDNKLIESLDNAAIRGEITVTKLSNLLERLDAYLMDMDTRLGDGVKWNTSAEIIKLFQDGEGN